MKPYHLFYKLFAGLIPLFLLLAVTAPVEAVASAAKLPGFEKFVKSVVNGEAGVVRGVYVPGVLALGVVQQPTDQPNFVSAKQSVATQFRFVASFGVTGLLAHNYLAGGQFFNLAVGQEVRTVYGDGSVKYYAVSAIRQYQALEPKNSYSDLVDLNSGETLSVGEVFADVYTGVDQVTFQTCIAKDGNRSWGRLFIIALPITK